MKKINRSVTVMSLLLAVSIMILSFSTTKGGEGFEIYLGNKLVLQKFGDNMNTVKSLQLNQSSSNDQLVVKYHHCGRVGKNRNITLKDEQNKIVKEWKFPDAPNAAASMTCNVKEIMNLKKGNSNTFSLYYSSSELPKGRMLTSLVLGTPSIARN